MRFTFAIAAICAAFFSTSAIAEDALTYTITFKDGSFEPKAFEIPSGERVTLEIVNAEKKVIEFESDDMKAEKIIRSGKTRKVKVGPLPAGEYAYFDEFNLSAGEGIVTVK